MTDNTAAFTIVNNAYLHFALTVADSYIKHNPDSVFYIFLLDRNDIDIEIHPSVRIIEVTESIIPDLKIRSSYYEITELSTSIKPNILLFMMDLGYKRVIYIDPDIYFYNSAAHIFELLNNYSIVVTPHSTSPIYDGSRPDDLTFLRSGTFNLGFIGVSDTQEGRTFLVWWSNRLAKNAFSSFSMGMFTDQKWIDLVPCYFNNYYILKNHGYNVAYWNLHERLINVDGEEIFVNGSEKLIFLHFSGIDIAGGGISKYQTRFDIFPNSDLENLFTEYRLAVLKNHAIHHSLHDTRQVVIRDMDRLLSFHNHIEMNEQEFSYDDRVVAIGNKMARLPLPVKKLLKYIVYTLLNNSLLRIMNNSVNKINLSYIVFKLGK
jgi:hypothetical protein